MKKSPIILLIIAMLLGLCACNDDAATNDPTKTTPTTQKRPDSSKPSDPTEPTTTAPPVTVNPVGVYRCTGIRTEQDTEYQEASYGSGMDIYDDGYALVYFYDYSYDLSWEMDGEQFLATTTDGTALTMEGALINDVLEVYFDGAFLRFQKKTQQDIAEESIYFLREMMEGSSQQCACAYLGWFEEAGSVQSWLQEHRPIALEGSPFIPFISEDRIIGTSGEVYCIVPTDAEASVTVSLLQDGTEDVWEVLYQSDSGEPFLLMCNAGGFYPDTRVTLTDSTGKGSTWYPQTDKYGILSIPEDDDLEEQVFDLSVYDELYPNGYNVWLSQGWWMTTEEELLSTCWTYYEITPEDRCWVLDFSGDTVQLDLMVDGVAIDAEHYTGSWYVEFSDGTGLTYLSLDLTSANGDRISGSYVVLTSPEKQEILLGTDADHKELPVPTNGGSVSIWWGAMG